MKQKLTYIRFSDYCHKTGNYVRVVILSAFIYTIIDAPIADAAEYYMGTGIVQGDLRYEHINPNSPYNPNNFPVVGNINSSGPKGPEPIADNELAVELDGLIATFGFHTKDVRSGLNLEIGYYALSGSYYNPFPVTGSSYFANIDYQNQYAVARYHIPFGRYFSAYAGVGLSNSTFTQSYANIAYTFGKVKPFYNYGIRVRLKTVFLFLDYSPILVEDKYVETGPPSDQGLSATPFYDTTEIKVDTITFGTSIYFGSGAR